jgi:hypothetical protein
VSLVGDSFGLSSGTKRHRSGGSMMATTLGKGVAAGAHGRGGEWRRSSVARGGVNWGAEAPFIGLGEGLRRQEKAVVCRSYGGGVNGDF